MSKDKIDEAKENVLESISISSQSTKELQILLSDLDIKIARMSKRDMANSEGVLKLISQRNTIAKLLKMNFLNEHIKAYKELGGIENAEDKKNDTDGFDIIDV